MVSFAFPLMAKVVPVPGMYIEDHLVATYGFKRAREPVADCFIVFRAPGVLSLNESSNAFAIRPLLTPCKNCVTICFGA
jgi:hypothetical protein